MLKVKERSARQQQSQPQLKAPQPEQLMDVASSADDEIRPLAYRKWQEAGCPASDGVEFWLTAETEIRRRKPR
jgi:hypothetical protein